MHFETNEIVYIDIFFGFQKGIIKEVISSKTITMYVVDITEYMGEFPHRLGIPEERYYPEDVLVKQGLYESKVYQAHLKTKRSYEK